MNERQVPEEGYDRVLAKFTGWTCLALVALIVPGCIAGSVGQVLGRGVSVIV